MARTLELRRRRKGYGSQTLARFQSASYNPITWGVTTLSRCRPSSTGRPTRPIFTRKAISPRGVTRSTSVMYTGEAHNPTRHRNTYAPDVRLPNKLHVAFPPLGAAKTA